MDEKLVFKPRRSNGWIWMIAIGLVFLTVAIIYMVVVRTPGVPLSVSISMPLVLSLLALIFLALAVWFPSMRYELEKKKLVLLYGPILRYEIPLNEIKKIHHGNLGFNLWSSVRFPGLALFTVPYSVGDVKMCSTAALKDILLIETKDDEFYGLSPADEENFVAALRQRTGKKFE